jgi:transposase InsO family protein
MYGLVDAHRDTYGVEPICKVLQIAPSAYRRYAARCRDASLLSARAKRDEALRSRIEQVWDANRQVYGADKVWKQMNREGVEVARCTVERLMRGLGLRGVRRGKEVRTTVTSHKRRRASWTRSIGSSVPSDRISFGYRTSPMSRHGRAGCTWPSSLTCSPNGSWAGA